MLFIDLDHTIQQTIHQLIRYMNAVDIEREGCPLEEVIEDFEAVGYQKNTVAYAMNRMHMMGIAFVGKSSIHLESTYRV